MAWKGEPLGVGDLYVDDEDNPRQPSAPEAIWELHKHLHWIDSVRERTADPQSRRLLGFDGFTMDQVLNAIGATHRDSAVADSEIVGHQHDLREWAIQRFKDHAGVICSFGERTEAALSALEQARSRDIQCLLSLIVVALSLVDGTHLTPDRRQKLDALICGLSVALPTSSTDTAAPKEA